MQRYALWFPSEQKHETFGYGRVRRRLLAALAHAGFRVLEGGDPPDNVIQVSHFQPFMRPEWRKRWERRPGVHAAILYTTFESTRIPPDYIAAAEDFDAVWTTSEWCKGVFMDEFATAGVDVPVHVVRHGIDSGFFPPMKRWGRGSKSEPFTFLWKGQNPNDRKNGNLAVEAFKAAAIPNTRMLVKAQPSFHPRGTFFNVDGVTYTSEWWDENEQRCALANADCFVQPTRAEGFGMEPLEALATCLPTIATGYSGITEYFFDGADIWKEHLTGHWLEPSRFSRDGIPCALGYPLPYEENDGYYNDEKRRIEQRIIDGDKRVNPGWLDFDVDYGKDAHISMDDVAEAMVYVHENWEGMRILSELASQRVHARWTWHRVVRDVVDALDAMGVLNEVAWMDNGGSWLTDVRNLRVPGWHPGPWAHGVEPEGSGAQVHDRNLVTEI